MTEEALFGRIEKLRAEGGHKADMEKLSLPFEDEDAFMRSFCTGCGLLAEIYQDEAIEHAQRAGIELLVDPKKYYFETGKCGFCDSEDENVKLLPIMEK